MLVHFHYEPLPYEFSLHSFIHSLHFIALIVDGAEKDLWLCRRATSSPGFLDTFFFPFETLGTRLVAENIFQEGSGNEIAIFEIKSSLICRVW